MASIAFLSKKIPFRIIMQLLLATTIWNIYLVIQHEKPPHQSITNQYIEFDCADQKISTQTQITSENQNALDLNKELNKLINTTNQDAELNSSTASLIKGNETATDSVRSCGASEFEKDRVVQYSYFQSQQCKPDIFFMFTNFDSQLPPMYCCAIASAAQNNPDSSVVVYMQDVESSWPDHSKCFGQHPNVFVITLSLEEVFENTRLAQWYADNDKWEISPKDCYTEQNYGNAARMALLYKHGGLYLDLDMITINTLDVLDDRAVGKQTKSDANTAAMNFPPRDPFVEFFIDQFIMHFDNCIWANNGPTRLTQALQSKGCLPSKRNQDGPTQTCETLTIYETKMFYPFNWESGLLSEHIDDKGYDDLMQSYKDEKDPVFAVHLWNKINKKQLSEIERGSDYVYERLMSQECGADWRTM